jgi:hypothetical protein
MNKEAMKEIRLKGYTQEFAEALAALKEQYSEPTNSKTIQRAVIERKQLERELYDAKRALSSLEDRHQSLVDYALELIQLDSKREMLVRQIKASV